MEKLEHFLKRRRYFYYTLALWQSLIEKNNNTSFYSSVGKKKRVFFRDLISLSEEKDTKVSHKNVEFGSHFISLAKHLVEGLFSTIQFIYITMYSYPR